MSGMNSCTDHLSADCDLMVHLTDKEKIEYICNMLDIEFDESLWPKSMIVNILMALTEKVGDLENERNE